MNDKVYFYHGWWKSRRVEGEVKGFIPEWFTDGKAIILVTKSESYLFRVGKYASVDISVLNKL